MVDGTLQLKNDFPPVAGMDKDRKFLSVLFILNIIIHLLLLGWFTGLYTDSVFLMDVKFIGKLKWLPLYPILLQLVNLVVSDPEVSGKLISSLATSLSIFPLYFIAKRIGGRKSGIYCVILFSCSAISMRWSLQVMTDTTFLLFFLLSIWNIIEFFPDMNKNRLRLATVTAALAALTRPEAMGLIPVLVLLYLWQFHRKGAREFFKTIWSASAWLPLPIWFIATASSNNYFKEISAEASKFDLSKIALFLITYLKAFPYILGYPIAIMALLGAYFLIKEKKPGFPVLFILLALMWLTVLMNHWAWTTRLVYPFVPLALILAAVGIVNVEMRFSQFLARVVFGVCVVYSLVFLVAVLHYQRDSFGDVKRSSLFIKENLSGKEVFTDELVKTNFWTGRELYFWAGKSFSPIDTSNLRKGDYVVLHSFYTKDIPKVLNHLNKRFRVYHVYRSESRIVPLLGDDIIMVTSNSPQVFNQRFTPQDFESVIIELR